MRGLGRVQIGFVILACTLPILSIWPMGSSIPNDYVRTTPLYLFTLGFIFLVGLWITSQDLFLGMFVMYVAMGALQTQTSLALAVAHWMLLGSFGILIVRSFQSDWLLKLGLTVVGIFEVIYAFIQSFQYDPLFIKGIAPVIFIHGTFGHHNFLGAFLAMLTPFVFTWSLPFFIFGLIMSQSLLSVGGALVGLTITYCHSFWSRITILGSGVLFILLFFWQKSLDSTHTRIEAWRTAFRMMYESWRSLLFGYGPGSWYTLVPAEQVRLRHVEPFYQGHNEYIQGIFEFGIIGFALVLSWLYMHRNAFKSGAFVTLIISSAGIYVFHLASLAIVAVVILGMATRKERTETWSKNSSAYWV